MLFQTTTTTIHQMSSSTNSILLGFNLNKHPIIKLDNTNGDMLLKDYLAREDK